MPRLTNAQIEHALKKTSGNVALASRELGVGRSTLYRHIRRSPNLAERLTDVREELVDFAESRLRTEVLSGNITAIIFTLKTIGKQRGYIERTEHVNLNVDADLLKRAIDALTDAGLDPAETFNDIIREAAELKQDAGATGGAPAADVG